MAGLIERAPAAEVFTGEMFRQVLIEGFDKFGFRFGGVEVGLRRRLLPVCFFLFSLSS